jgi:hypothetical protein
MELDIEKIEAIDDTYIANQVACIFKSEKDVNNFIAFLKNIKNFVSLSNDKRHMTLMELCYFKSQIQLFEKRIQSLINQYKTKQTKAGYKKAKLVGEKISEQTILCNSEDVTGLNELEALHNIVYSWFTYLQDLYYMCGQTNKNLGGFTTSF